MELVGNRRAECVKMEGQGALTHIEFTIPARGLIGRGALWGYGGVLRRARSAATKVFLGFCRPMYPKFPLGGERRVWYPNWVEENRK